MTKIVDGKALAAAHQQALQKKIKRFKNNRLKVVSLLVGDDPASLLYSEVKQKKAAELSIGFEIKRFDNDPKNWEIVIDEIKKRNKDKAVAGLMVQLPLPKEFLDVHEPQELLKLISPKKDVDGLSGKNRCLPAVVRAVLSVLRDEKVLVKGKNVVVIGSSPSVGLVIAKQLKKLGGKVIICDINTKNLVEETQKADILISATGEADLVIARMVKEGVVVIDVGISKIEGQISGDVHFESVSPKCSIITPVPGGIGPMTVISLMENIIDSVYNR